MMAGLALVAGTAMALNDSIVYAGGTYSYQLNDIEVNTTGQASFEFTDADSNTGRAIFGNFGGGFTSGTPVTAATATASTFDITFNGGTTNPVAEGIGTLRVEILDGGSNACSNFIEYQIRVMPPPTYDLIVEASESALICQTRNGAGNNTANALGDGSEENTFTFTVTPDFNNIIEGTDFTYSFSINIDEFSALTDFDITGPNGEIAYGTNELYTFNGTYTTPYTSPEHTFTVTFKTTTGAAAQEILATLPLISGTDVLTVVGNVTEDADIANTGDDTATLTVGAVPSIGQFGN